MARIRTVKPELAAHEGLFDLERETGLPIRFAWCMLFTVADREGRFVWRPRTLKVQVLPHDELDFSRVLDAWVTRGFVVKYRVKDEWYGWIPTFTKHQVINNRESPSDLPSVDEADEIDQGVKDASATREARVSHAGKEEGKEGKGKEGETHASRTRAAQAEPEGFQETWARYPKRHGTNSRADALRAYKSRIAEGVKPEAISAGVAAYAAHVRATGKEGSEFVMQASRFFGQGKHYEAEWSAQVPRETGGPVSDGKIECEDCHQRTGSYTGRKCNACWQKSMGMAA